MANAVPILSENPGTSKRKRSHVYPSEPQEQDGGGGVGEPSTELKKKKITDQRGAWANLDLILSLQVKDTPIQRKIEIVFDYVSLIGDGDDQGAEVVGIPRLVSFLIDWIQLHLISFESSKRNAEFCDSCLDYRCWAVLRFCLQKSSVGVSLNLLRAVTRVLHHALLRFDGDSSLLKVESDELFKHVFECLSLLLLSNSRVFYKAGVELWVSCAAEAVNLVLKVFMNDELGSSSAGILTSLSSLLLEDFAGFLRFHPNPRNVFHAFVDRLLEPLLELLVLLQLRVNERKCQKAHNLLRIVKEVLSNGVFHPVHINGLLCLKSSNAEDGRRLKGINESYHRHFFRRLEKMIAEKKAVSLGGFGYLLCLFINEVRSKKTASLASKVNNASGRRTEIPEKAEETSKPFFGVFTQFLEPLVLECKRCAELDLSLDKEILEISCQVINIYGELRQVNSPIFALCRAVRLFAVTSDAESTGAVREPCIGETLCNKVDMHQIALELIRDSALYEQAVLSKHLTSKLCHVLKKSFTFLINHDSTSGKDMYSLSEWSEILTTLIQGPVVDMGGGHALPTSLSASNLVHSDISSTIPSGRQSDYATYILNLERKFIGRPVKLHLRTAIQAIERALIGTPQGCHMVYEVRTGDFDGGTVSPNVAGGIDCLDLVLEYVSVSIKLPIRANEVEQCVAVLQDSVITLLNCLETFGTNSHGRKGYFTWDVQEAVKCASFLRRIYEEIRQQKDALGRHSIYFLSSYINVYSGFGPFQTGIKREIDEALRPGIYSLIDICTASDIQQLHTVLDESSCRSTLSTLLHDYQLNFQYEGKV
ncbi:Urb2/Npa2 family [Musa troglodytarum]|uniref:Urb2/Npa2 family n=1 Tax=Musa troglodytarum TaxID=320322 RepID=A0A9E7G3L7_9LILI|nr:Urb2/Npa2 family [Musa troglodytarum]